jgi:hypothetical protein
MASRIEDIPAPPASLSEIVALVGGEDSSRHMAILATGASCAEIEQALAYVAGAGEALGKSTHPLSGRVAAVYDLLTADLPDDEA